MGLLNSNKYICLQGKHKHGLLQHQTACIKASDSRLSINQVLPNIRLSMSNEESAIEDIPQRPLLYSLLWVGFLSYAFALAPGGSAEATALDNELIQHMVTTPFDGMVNPLFVAIFNFLGVIPATYAALLLPGSKNQKFPAAPFVIGSFALGYVALAPYLAFRSLRTQVPEEDRTSITGLFESKLAAVPLIGFAAYLYYYLFSQAGATPEGLSGVLEGYLALFSSQKLVHASSIDFLILSLAMYEPMREDLSRRDSQGWGVPAWVFCLLPALGPALYLLLRPPLPSDSDSE